MTRCWDAKTDGGEISTLKIDFAYRTDKHFLEGLVKPALYFPGIVVFFFLGHKNEGFDLFFEAFWTCLSFFSTKIFPSQYLISKWLSAIFNLARGFAEIAATDDANQSMAVTASSKFPFHLWFQSRPSLRLCFFLYLQNKDTTNLSLSKQRFYCEFFFSPTVVQRLQADIHLRPAIIDPQRPHLAGNTSPLRQLLPSRLQGRESVITFPYRFSLLQAIPFMFNGWISLRLQSATAVCIQLSLVILFRRWDAFKGWCASQRIPAVGHNLKI